MSFNAAALKVMLAKGLTLGDVAEIAEALEAAPERSPGAIRQARYRQRGGGKIPTQMRETVFERDGWQCLDCGAQEYLCCDHVVPVSKGGETSLDNLQTLCVPCNSKKKDRIRKRDKARLSSGSSAENPRKVPPNERDNLTPSGSQKPEPKGSVKKFGPPDEVPAETWSDFLLSPKRRKAGMSATAYAGICNNLTLLAEHGFPPGDMIALAVERGWTTVKLEWVLNDQRIARNERNNSPSPLDQLVAASLGYGPGVGESP